MFIGKYNKSVILTYFGVALSIFGMSLALTGKVNYALLCLIVAGICDLFDGTVARMCKRTEEEKSFGVQIDSLADMIDFVAFPIIISWGLGLTSWYHIAMYVFYALCAITRLGYFNISVAGKRTEEPIKYYSGLPVTYAALIFPLVWLVSFTVSDLAFKVVYEVAMGVIAFLFILNVKIPKPRGAAYAVFIAMAVGMISFIVYMGLR